MLKDLRRLVSKAMRIILNPPALTNCNIDKTSVICEGSQATNVDMKKMSYIGCFCFLVNTEIGAFCSIADNCRIGGAEHPISRVSTSPVFHSGRNVLKRNYTKHGKVETKRVIIGNDVWIGANSCIKSGTTISDGAVIGMGSVVTKDVGPYEVWGGNPAKLIKKRFSDDTIDRLESIKWWNLEDSEIIKYSEYFCSTEDFISKIEIEGKEK